MNQLGRATKQLIDTNNLLSEAQARLNLLRVEESSLVEKLDKLKKELYDTVRFNTDEINKQLAVLENMKISIVSLHNEKESLEKDLHVLDIKKRDSLFELDGLVKVKKEKDAEYNQIVLDIDLLKEKRKYILTEKKIHLNQLEMIKRSISAAKDSVSSIKKILHTLSDEKKKLEINISNVRERELRINNAEERIAKREHFIRKQYDLLGITYPEIN